MKKKPLIIGFGHKARRGKDTVVAHLIETFKGQYDIRRYAFADELKKEFTTEVERRAYAPRMEDAELAIRHLERWAGVQPDYNMAYDDPRCPYGKPRFLLQWWGTEYRRQGRIPGQSIPEPDEFYWVRKLRDTIRNDNPQIALVSDMRFYNEAAMVKSEDVTNKTVRVEREGFDLGDASRHPSETELDGYGYDYVIHVKDGDIDELKKDAVFVMHHIIDSFKVTEVEVVDESEKEEMITILPAAKKPSYNISTKNDIRSDVPVDEFNAAVTKSSEELNAEVSSSG